MQITSHHIQTCTEAWLNCENLLIALFGRENSFSKRTTQVIDDCAAICLGTLQAVKQQYQNLSEVALLCVGICEECAEVCERYSESVFQNCASSCRQCSNAFSQIASEAI